MESVEMISINPFILKTHWELFTLIALQYIFLSEKLTIFLSKGKLDLAIVLDNMDFELGVNVGEVDESEGVVAGLPQHSLEDAVNNNDHMVPPKRFL